MLDVGTGPVISQLVSAGPHVGSVGFAAIQAACAAPTNSTSGSAIASAKGKDLCPERVHLIRIDRRAGHGSGDVREQPGRKRAGPVRTRRCSSGRYRTAPRPWRAASAPGPLPPAPRSGRPHGPPAGSVSRRDRTATHVACCVRGARLTVRGGSHGTTEPLLVAAHPGRNLRRQHTFWTLLEWDEGRKFGGPAPVSWSGRGRRREARRYSPRASKRALDSQLNRVPTHTVPARRARVRGAPG